MLWLNQYVKRKNQTRLSKNNGIRRVVYNSITYVIKRIKHEYDKQRTARDKRPRKRDTE